MSTCNIYFHREVRKILSGYSLSSGAMGNVKRKFTLYLVLNFIFQTKYYKIKKGSIPTPREPKIVSV